MHDTILTIISTVMLISSAGNSVTQTTYPVTAPSCNEAVKKVWGYGTQIAEGVAERRTTLRNTAGGNPTTKIETLECVLRPEGL